MATGTEGTSTAGGESFTLGNEIAELMGDHSFSESPEPVVTDAGAPPADANAATPDNAPGSEGAPPDAAHAGAPPAVAADATPDATQTPDDDPLIGSAAMSYTVDGQERTFDGITVLKGGGAIIAPDHLPKLQQRLSERDHLFERSQAEYRKYADLERLTTWPTRDAQGNASELRGTEGLAAQRTLLARSLATLNTMSSVFSDPASAGKYAQVVQTGTDAQTGEPLYELRWNTDALDSLKTRSELAATKAEQVTRSHLASLAAPPAPAETPIAQLADSTIASIAQQHGIAGLTADDTKVLAKQLERYVRPSTAQERAQGMPPRVVDDAFVEVMKDRAALRSSSTASASAAANAATENARRLAAASLGRRPSSSTSTPTPNASPRTPTPNPNAVSQDALWERMERAAAGRA